MNPWKAVIGKLPTQTQMLDFTADRWFSLLQFIEFFIEFKDRKGNSRVEDRFTVTAAKIAEMEKYLESPGHPFQEWMYRIDIWSDDNHKAFYYKFINLARIALSYLKRHPSSITPPMEELMQKYPNRMGRALLQYKVVDTGNGEVVSRDKMMTEGNGNKQTPTTMQSVQVKMMNSLVKLADLYEDLSGSISKSELKDMETKDKLNALSKLSFIFGMAQKKVGPSHFTQINLNGSTKDVEKAMLDYVKKVNE